MPGWCVANVRSAQAAGATVVSYASVDGLLQQQGRVVGVTVRSTLAGEDRAARVMASLVISAAGVWVDKVRMLEAGQGDTRLALSRGIHLVLHRDRLPVNTTIILPTRDKRMAFAVPRGRFTYLGTTDVFHDRPEYWPDFDRTDVDYLRAAAERNLRTAPITDDDIVAMWSGIRPLVSRARQEARGNVAQGRDLDVACGPRLGGRRKVERVSGDGRTCRRSRCPTAGQVRPRMQHGDAAVARR